MAEEEENIGFHFDISAAVIRQLGEELVTDEVTAIMELIKNSYDADADWVKVEINTREVFQGRNTHFSDNPPGYILIEDNGFGMNQDDVSRSWLKISLSGKRKFKAEGRTTTKGRTPLGEKGVGRLSSQKLGKRLEMFSREKETNKSVHVAFDWDDFTDDRLLSSVPVHLTDLNSSEQTNGGTALVITKLLDPKKWEDQAWDKFRGSLAQMIFPYKEHRKFNVFVRLNSKNVDLDELSHRIRELRVAHFAFRLLNSVMSLEGVIKTQKLLGGTDPDKKSLYDRLILPDGGRDFFHFLTDPVRNKRYHLTGIEYSGVKGEFFRFTRAVALSELGGAVLIPELEGVDKLEVANPGEFHGEIDDFYFNPTDELNSAFDSLSEFRNIVQTQSGVRIFRDGFGIKPYGIDGEDWLRLGGSQTSGGSYYGLRPKNIVGFVEISASGNQNLKEKTDREGFMDNPYSANFHRLMHWVRENINDTLEAVRRSYNDYQKSVVEQSTGVSSIAQSFETLKKTASHAKTQKVRSKAVEDRINILSQQAEEATKRMVKSDKVDNTVKELLDSLTTLLHDAGKLLKDLGHMLDGAEALDSHVQFLQPQIEGIQEQLTHFSELAGLGLTAEALTHELENILDRINVQTEQASKHLKGGQLRLDDIHALKTYVEFIRGTTRSFRKQLSHLSPSLRFVKESREKINIRDFMADTEDYYRDRFNGRIGLAVKTSNRSYVINMNPGKLTQILDNIILNSEYWLNEKNRREKGFKPQITIEISEPFIHIYDNGDGIDVNIEDRVFQPFTTSKPKKVGRGLGLFIVQQLLESEGCSIRLMSERNDSGKRFKFQIDFSSAIVDE